MTIANGTGQHGVAAHFAGTNAVGLEIQVVGPQATPGTVSTQVAAMMQSVRPIEGSGS